MLSTRSYRPISCISFLSRRRSMNPDLARAIHTFRRNSLIATTSRHQDELFAPFGNGQQQSLIKGTATAPSSLAVGVTISLTQRPMVTVTKTSTTSPSPPTIEVTQVTPTQSSSTDESLSLSSIQDNNAVIITPSAIEQINRLAKQRNPEDPSNVFLRVYVDAGGCSGFQYKFELEQKDDEETPIDPEEDVIFQVSLSDGSLPCIVVIDEGSLEYIQGSTIDFVREMVRSSFAVVNNPQSESACGCGSSFAVKNFESNPALD